MQAVIEIKSRQVAYCIQQAQEYYRAAASVTLRTSPLLYYYGMLSLAKALIVANEPETVLDDIKFKYHGLKADKSVQSEKLEDQAAVVSGGVFPHLCGVSDGLGLPHNTVIRLGDVLSISPELGEMYERLLRRPRRSVNDYDLRVQSRPAFQLTISTAKSTPYGALDRIPELQTDFDLVPGQPSDYFITLQSKPGLKEFPIYLRRYAAPIGGRYIVASLATRLNSVNTSTCISPPLSDYIAMFILASCVRYKQDLWGEVVQGRETGILGLIDLLLAISRRRFPSMILDKLFGEHFEYGAPGRIS